MWNDTKTSNDEAKIYILRVGVRKALTVRHRVVNEDRGLARFSQDSIHRHAKDKLKALCSLQLRLSQVIEDGDLKSLHADARSKVQVTADSHVVGAGWCRAH